MEAIVSYPHQRWLSNEEVTRKMLKVYFPQGRKTQVDETAGNFSPSENMRNLQTL